MKTSVKLITMGAISMLLTSCGPTKTEILKQSDFPQPPVAQILPQVFNEFGNERVDNYYWLRDKTSPAVIDYLNQENNYTDSVMSSTKALQDTIYNEITGRIKDADESYPVLMNQYNYYSRTEAGKQYRIYLRKANAEGAQEELLFDVNQMAEGKKAMRFAGYNISPDNKLAAYSFNETGSFADYIIKVKSLETGKDLGVNIPMATSYQWANDNKTLYYVLVDKALRPYKVMRHKLGKSGNDEVIYEESDARYNVYLSKTKTDKEIFIISSSTYTSEYRSLDADNPAAKPEIFLPREQGVDYSVIAHSDKYFLRYKDSQNLNGMIYELPLKGFQDKSTWKVFVAHDPAVRLEGFDVLKDYVVIDIRMNGLNQFKYFSLKDGSQGDITFPEPVYSAGLNGNPEFDATTVRYNYTSLNRPSTLYEFDLAKGESIKLKEQEIPSGFNADDYVVERLWAKAQDGVEVPMAIVYKKGLKKNGKSPALLYSYGSYGSSSDVYFSPSYYSLIDRGFVVAIAQIRGGSDLGEQWYEDGKLLKKKNTFTDFIACAEKLIDDKYTSADKLAGMGGSAGGLLVGAVANMRPDLFNTIVAAVPFVDVINTMLDTSLPLTTQEYEEWGNPNEEEYYRYMLSYSPYDNVTAQKYPNILATGGLNDSQVGFHEPAKWVAKLRALKKDDNVILLHTNMESGHGGATGRYDRIKETAFEWAFILNRVGIDR
ncbi:MAG: S9 family peptidase [Bacteroidales bacterium]|jgi:oligopeptidase B|nr:S9 family peptidase [Bacteroidales bacterium]